MVRLVIVDGIVPGELLGQRILMNEFIVPFGIRARRKVIRLVNDDVFDRARSARPTDGLGIYKTFVNGQITRVSNGIAVCLQQCKPLSKKYGAHTQAHAEKQQKHSRKKQKRPKIRPSAPLPCAPRTICNHFHSCFSTSVLFYSTTESLTDANRLL